MISGCGHFPLSPVGAKTAALSVAAAGPAGDRSRNAVPAGPSGTKERDVWSTLHGVRSGIAKNDLAESTASCLLVYTSECRRSRACPTPGSQLPPVDDECSRTARPAEGSEASGIFGDVLHLRYTTARDAGCRAAGGCWAAAAACALRRRSLRARRGRKLKAGRGRPLTGVAHSDYGCCTIRA
jgi:hypothetical protein